MSFSINHEQCFQVPNEFHDILYRACEKLLSLSSRELQHMIAESSSSAVLALLIRVLTNEKILSSTSLFSSSSSSTIASNLFYSALECPLSFQDNNTSLVEDINFGDQSLRVFYDMAGDKAGSYFLQTVLECCDLKIIELLVPRAIMNSVKDYAEEKVGNFVLQSVLKRLTAILTNKNFDDNHSDDEDNNNSIIRKTSIGILEEFLDKSSSFEFVVDERGGVLLWILELCNAVTNASTRDWSTEIGMRLIEVWIEKRADADDKLNIQEEDDDGKRKIIQLTSAINNIFRDKLISEGDDPSKKDDRKSNSANKKKKKKATGNSPMDPYIAYMVTLLLQAKLFSCLLKSNSRKVSSLVSKAFSMVSSETLLYIAKNGQLSKVMFDIFFKLHAKSGEFKAISQTLVACGIELATHFVGQHIVRQAFEFSDLRGKEKWAMVLSKDRDQLIKTKEGRSSLNLVNAEQYLRDATEWRSVTKKNMKAANILQDIMTTKEHTKRNRDGASEDKTSDDKTIDNKDDSETEEMLDNIGNNKSGRKRKRKRQRK